MTENRLMFGKYYIFPAVQAMKILVFECHPIREIDCLIWGPMKESIQRLSQAKPRLLTCFSLPPFIPGMKGLKTLNFLSIIGANGELITLGRVENAVDSQRHWNDTLKRYKGNQEKTEYLNQHTWEHIRRDHSGYTIPVAESEINKLAVQQAVKKFMSVFCRPLSRLPVKLLHLKEQEDLQVEITRQASRVSTPTSREERIRIIVKDSEILEYI